jgi:predicted ArsR family transcriptional regulator
MTATVTRIHHRGKTEQRISAVLKVLQKASGPLTYDDLVRKTGTSYDPLLYILGTLVEVGYLEREDVVEGPGRPRVYFTWVPEVARGGARAMGARKR